MLVTGPIKSSARHDLGGDAILTPGIRVKSEVVQTKD